MNPINKVFEYAGNKVRMRKMGERNIQICVTDFAKTFPNKTLSHILNSQELTAYIKTLSDMQNCTSADLLQVTKGGNPYEQGTWANSKVALRIAQKLSPEFSIWVDMKTEELLTTGNTSLSPYRLPQTYAEALRELADKTEENERLMLENKKKDTKIAEDAPKVVFADAMLSSPDSISIKELSNILCQNGYTTGELRLYEQLRKEGYLCAYGSEKNLPRQRYLEMGLFEIEKKPFSDKRGIMRNSRTTKVMPKGVNYFISKFISQTPTLFDCKI